MYDVIDQLAVNTIRMLSIDAVETAKSGHTGLPLGAAPMAYTLWRNHYKTNPKNSKWFNRDRFILSAGHGSALLYSLLHLSGFDLTVNDLKDFRKLGSRTPGHPEVNITDGVDATTGPLGQGVAMGVGMAMVEKHLSAKFNKKDYPVVDHFTYVLCSDGDLQEGISYEASSLAGNLELDKLIVLYDSNDTQIEGPTEKTFNEDIQKRFESQGWEYSIVKDGNDLNEINKAIENAKLEKGKPSLIEVKTEIGYGTPSAGTSDAHSDPIGKDNVATTKENYSWKYEESFYVPDEVYTRFKDNILIPGERAEEKWNKLLIEYTKEYPDLSKKFKIAIKDELPVNWSENLPEYKAGEASIASRAVSNEVINAIAKKVPNFWGGSADLAGSNKAKIDKGTDFSSDNYEGVNIWYGVREHAMASILNGILLHGGTKSFVSTYFVFSDYMRPAIRLAALSDIPSIYVLTHDSVAVGEDGPTHEPVEQLSSFRGMPNLTTIRPADSNEVVAAWKLALESKDRPILLVLTRQDIPTLEGTKNLANKYLHKGAYVISHANDEPRGILLATGSEVQLAVKAQEELLKKGHDVSVVSMPSLELFEVQSAEYKESVLPRKVKKRLAVELGSSFGWGDFVGLDGAVISVDRFGTSGSGEKIIKKLGFTVDRIVEKYLSLND